MKENKQATKYKKLKVFWQWTRNERRGGVEPGEWGDRWGGLLMDREERGKGLISIRQDCKQRRRAGHTLKEEEEGKVLG